MEPSNHTTFLRLAADPALEQGPGMPLFLSHSQVRYLSERRSNVGQVERTPVIEALFERPMFNNPWANEPRYMFDCSVEARNQEGSDRLMTGGTESSDPRIDRILWGVGAGITPVATSGSTPEMRDRRTLVAMLAYFIDIGFSANEEGIENILSTFASVQTLIRSSKARNLIVMLNRTAALPERNTQ